MILLCNASSIKTMITIKTVLENVARIKRTTQDVGNNVLNAENSQKKEHKKTSLLVFKTCFDAYSGK